MGADWQFRSRDGTEVGSLAGVSEFHPVPGESAVFRCAWSGVKSRSILLMVTFEGQDYPFEDHCRYASHRGTDAPYTYPNMEFQDNPPGIRVGPWPGWRGIPAMPPVHFRCGGETRELAYQFWGDELALRHVLAVGMIPTGEYPEITLEVSDSRLKPVRAEFFFVVPPAIVPRPFEIPVGDSSRHPRLLVSQEDLEFLKDTSRPGRRRSLGRLQELLANWHEPLRKTAESKIAPGPEGLSDEDRLLIGACVALVDPREENRDRALRAYLDYVQRTAEESFTPLSIDTQAGEVLFLLSIGYDWLQGFFSSGQKATARRRLWEVADICWSHLGYERRDFGQAHFLGCGMGLLSFSLLFWDEHPRAKEWGAYFCGVVRWVLSALSPDGFYAHGINLWIYEFGFLLRWLELFRSAAGIDLWKEYDVLAQASWFRLAATSPDGLYGITMGDPQYRVGGDSWCHYLIASRTGSGEAQWLGDLLRDLPAEGVDFRNSPARRRVYEYLWHDEGIPARNEDNRLTIFEDGTQVFTRTEETLFTFRSGPPLGAHRYRSGISGAYGHSDPCNGAFLHYAGGFFGVTGPGPVYRRDSLLHNVVTIDGQGQMGDAAVWLPDFFPASSLPVPPLWKVGKRTLSISADITQSYLPHLGARRIRRSLLVFPGRYVVGADDILLEGFRIIQWNLHSAGEFRAGPTGYFKEFGIYSGDRRMVRLLMLSPSSAEWRTGFSEFVPAYPNDGTRDRFFRISLEGRQARFLWCLLLSEDVSAGPPAGGGFIRFQDGDEATYDGTWIRLDGGS